MGKILKIIGLPVLWTIFLAFPLAIITLGLQHLGLPAAVLDAASAILVDLFFFAGTIYLANKEGLLKRELFSTVSKQVSLYSFALFLLMAIPLTAFDTFFPLPDLVLKNINLSSFSFIIMAVIIAPIGEELLFRGFVTRILLNRYSPTKAIFISALIFGLIHVNPAQIPGAFLMGLLFGWIFYKTGSIIPGMILHFINNAICCIPNIDRYDATILNNGMAVLVASVVASAAFVLLFLKAHVEIRRIG